MNPGLAIPLTLFGCVIAQLPVVAADDEDKKLSPVRKSDAEKAINIANAYAERSQWESAATWFKTALEWDSGNVDAAKGFVDAALKNGKFQKAYQVSDRFSKILPELHRRVVGELEEVVYRELREGRIQSAQEILKNIPGSEPGLKSAREQLKTLRQGDSSPSPEKGASEKNTGRSISQKMYLKSAAAAYLDRQYSTSLWNLNEANRLGALPREGAVLRGWCLYRVGRIYESAFAFEKLYQTQADMESARGIILSLQRQGNHFRLARLAEEWGGLLAQESKKPSRFIIKKEPERVSMVSTNSY